METLRADRARRLGSLRTTEPVGDRLRGVRLAAGFGVGKRWNMSDMPATALLDLDHQERTLVAPDLSDGSLVGRIALDGGSVQGFFSRDRAGERA